MHRWDAPHAAVQVAEGVQAGVQSTQRPPGAPHAFAAVPGSHVVPLQHAALQAEEALQVVEQAPPLQALPERQSASELHPQVLPATHAAPFLPAQSTQAVPEPHAADVLAVQVPADPLQQ